MSHQIPLATDTGVKARAEATEGSRFAILAMTHASGPTTALNVKHRRERTTIGVGQRSYYPNTETKINAGIDARKALWESRDG